MKGSRQSLAMMAVIAVASVGASACGSSSSKPANPAASTPATPSTPTASTTASTGAGTALSPTAYKQKVLAVLAPVIQAVNQVGAKPGNASNDLQALSQIVSRTPIAVAALGKLTPPPADAPLQPKLITALNALATDAGKFKAAAQSQDSAALRTATSALETDQAQLNSVLNQIRANG